MDPRPVKREGNSVTFADGSTSDVFSIAREWATWQEALYGEACMAPSCAEIAQHNASLYGHHIGRLCDGHLGAWTNSDADRSLRPVLQDLADEYDRLATRAKDAEVAVLEAPYIRARQALGQDLNGDAIPR